MRYAGGFTSNDINHRIERALMQQADRQRIAKAAGEKISKAGITTSTGITAYNLEAPVQGNVPTRTPFLDIVPRRTTHQGGLGIHWNSLTVLDSANTAIGVSQGARGASISPTVTPGSSLFATLGLENDYTYEAEEAAESYDNVPQRSTEWLLAQFRIAESRVVADGVASTAAKFGTTPTPTGTTGTALGTLTSAGAYFARCVALSLDGLNRASVAGGVVQTYTRNNNDGTSSSLNGGSAIQSAASASITAGTTPNASINLAVTAVRGAAGYAWYLGTSTSNMVLAAITTLNRVTITAPPAGTQLASAVTADCSNDTLVYDGLFTQFANASSGSYFFSMDGAAFTTGNGGTINELNVAFEYLWVNYRIRPTRLICGGITRVAISNAIFATTGPVYRVDLGANGTDVKAGKVVTHVLNPVTGDLVEIVVDPWAPNNQLKLVTEDLPEYTIPEVPLPYNVATRMRDYYQIEWPITTRTRYTGIYYSGMLQLRVPFSGAVLVNTP
jgi:hypothetical protein